MRPFQVALLIGEPKDVGHYMGYLRVSDDLMMNDGSTRD
jgi:hypothetical protein